MSEPVPSVFDHVNAAALVTLVTFLHKLTQGSCTSLVCLADLCMYICICVFVYMLELLSPHFGARCAGAGQLRASWQIQNYRLRLWTPRCRHSVSSLTQRRQLLSQLSRLLSSPGRLVSTSPHLQPRMVPELLLMKKQGLSRVLCSSNWRKAMLTKRFGIFLRVTDCHYACIYASNPACFLCLQHIESCLESHRGD